MTENKKKSRFGVGLLIYAWALLILCGAGLFFFREYIQHYEYSQPKYFLESYRSGLEQSLPEAAREALSVVDPEIEAPEKTLRLAQELMQGVILVKDPARCTSDQLVYLVKTADGKQAATVTFAVTGKDGYGVPKWEPVEEDYDFSPYFEMAEICAPPGYTVFLGERKLGPSDVADRQVPYEALEECYQHYERLPRLLRYQAGPFLGKPPVRICDGNGRELSPEEQTEEGFLDNCGSEVRAMVEEFVPEFIPAYAFYSADVNGSAMMFFGKLSSFVVPNSQLQTRMRQAIGSFGYSNTHNLKVLSTQVNYVCDLGENRYLADVTYVLEITALGGPVEKPDQVRIVLIEQDGKLLADALYHY